MSSLASAYYYLKRNNKTWDHKLWPQVKIIMVAEALALKIYIDLLNQLVKDIRQKNVGLCLINVVNMIWYLY